MIDRDSPVAPWRQLHALLAAQIASGELAPGDRLPSIVSLHQEYGLAHTTVAKALAALQEDGLVITSPMGTFVAERD
jgi:GntR family transcriptional regulator